MIGHILQKKYWLDLFLFFLICSSLLSACGGNPLPTDQANKCVAQSLPQIQNFTRLAGSTQTLYVGSGTNLYALNAANGTLRWCNQLSQSGPGIASGGQVDNIEGIALDHTNLYTYTEDFPENLIAFNPATGALRWGYNRGANWLEERNGVNVVNVPAANQIIYDGLDTMYALDEQDGTIRWQKVLGKNADIDTFTLPIVKDGIVYVGVNDMLKAGVIALDAATGNQKWLIEWPRNDAYGGQSYVNGNLIADQGKVFFSSLGQLDAVDARTGVSIWQDQVNPIDNPLLGANGLLYVQGFPGSNPDTQYLYAIDMRTGSIRWSFPTSNLYLLNGNNVYVLYQDSKDQNNTGYDLTAINAQNGQRIWHTHYQLAQPEASFARKLVVMDNEVYLGGPLDELTKPNTFAIHAFQLYSGVEDWSATVFGSVRGSDPSDVTFIDMVGSQ